MAPQTRMRDERRSRASHAGDADRREPEVQAVDHDERDEWHRRRHAAAEQRVGHRQLADLGMVEDRVDGPLHREGLDSAEVGGGDPRRGEREDRADEAADRDDERAIGFCREIATNKQREPGGRVAARGYDRKQASADGLRVDDAPHPLLGGHAEEVRHPEDGRGHDDPYDARTEQDEGQAQGADHAQRREMGRDAWADPAGHDPEQGRAVRDGGQDRDPDGVDAFPPRDRRQHRAEEGARDAEADPRCEIEGQVATDRSIHGTDRRETQDRTPRE